MADCTFCAIASAELDATIVHEDEETVAFLDRRPLFPGHVLLIPRIHCVTIEDLPAGLVAPLFATAQTLTGAVRRAMGAEGTFVALNNTVSQSVPHLHVHIVPRVRSDGLRGFFWPRNPYEDEAAMKAAGAAIRAELD